jgi:hypothetical protein
VSIKNEEKWENEEKGTGELLSFLIGPVLSQMSGKN